VIASPRGGAFSGQTDAALEALGRSRRVVLSVSSFAMVPEVIEASDLVALVPERLVRGLGERLEVLEPPLQVAGYTIGLVWGDRVDAHPAHRWFRQRVASLAPA
jgi:DNA-binding transcriptional LysR family regulator